MNEKLELMNVLEELANVLPEVRDTDIYNEIMPIAIDSWRDWDNLNNAPAPDYRSNYKKINTWVVEQLEKRGIDSYYEELGGGMQGVGIQGDCLYALFSMHDDYGMLGVYSSDSDDLPLFMLRAEHARKEYKTPVDWIEAVAQLLGISVFANRNFGGCA